MTILTFANHKGGTGKTTSAMSVAAAIGMCGYRVLAIDLDPQCFLTRMLGQPEPPVEGSSLSLFDPQSQLTPDICSTVKWFDLLPASARAPGFLRKLSKATDVLWVRESLREAKVSYDVVIIDTAAAVTAYSLGALVAADTAVIPVVPEYQPVIGGEQSFGTIETVRKKLNPDMESPRFLLTRVDARKKTHHDYRQYMRQKYGSRVLRRFVRTSASISLSCHDGSTIFDHDPGSRAAIDYANVADELLGLIQSRNLEDVSRHQSDQLSNVVD